MTCREKILSNDYVDIMTDFMIPPELIRTTDYCQTTLEPDLQISYINRRYISNISISSIRYNFIPKCYGIMEDKELIYTQLDGTVIGVGNESRQEFNPQPLIETGIIQTNGAPLNLTGRGVIIGIIDTGERVIIMSS